MKTLPIFAIVLTAALSLPLAASAADEAVSARPGGRGAAAQQRLKFLTEKLSLTEEQQTRIKAVFAKYAPQLREFAAKGRDNLSADEKAKARELIKSEAEEIGTVLTPEQREKWKEARAAGGPGARRGKADAAK